VRAKNVKRLPTSEGQRFQKQMILLEVEMIEFSSSSITATTNQKSKTSMKKLIVLGLAICLVPALAAQAADGKENYEKSCAKCHGADGKGQTKMGQKVGCKDYTDPKVQGEMKDEAAFKAIKEGFSKDDKQVMKPAEGLSDDDIKALVAYMRTFKK
jgi:cytochrome c553